MASMGPMMFGRTCLRRMNEGVEPSATAASMNSRVFTSSVTALARRAYGVHAKMVTARTMVPKPRSSIEANAKATTRSGKTRTTSTTRIAASSVAPPTLPAMAPTSVPNTPEIRTATVVMAREKRLPMRSRDSTSRPRWSVPRG